MSAARGRGRWVRLLCAGVARYLPERALERAADEALRLRHGMHRELRRRQGQRRPEIEPPIVSMTGERLRRAVRAGSPPWSTVRLRELAIPGMLAPEERQYYDYVCGFYSGVGEVVELGCWLGLSTAHIVRGLDETTGFRDRRLNVFDDFVWRSEWMDPCLHGTGIRSPRNHESFLELFQAQVRPFEDRLRIQRGRLAEFDGNEALPLVSWSGSPIEMIFVDCGRGLAVNEAWWRIFSPSFLPDRTLVILQDWGHFARVPEVWWENTKLFTDSHAAELELVHEVREGALATFLVRR
jgi:hypothetical protein